MTTVLDEATALSAAGRPFVLATVVWRRAPTSGKPGAKAIVFPDGTVHGWIGGACAQPTLVRQAHEVLESGDARLVFFGPADEMDGVLRDGVVRVPMACDSEGSMEIYLEPMLPSPHVLAVGDSELTTALAALARDVGWTAEVTDTSGGFVADARTAIVVATQGRWDEAAVQDALATDAGYVGLVASKRRAATVVEWLDAAGATDRDLARLHAPAGLDLGAVAHREIAASVLAELVALRAAGGLRWTAENAQPMPLEAVDPVCGMTVTVASARHVSGWNGHQLYFCAASCKRTFEESPEKYADAFT